MIPPPPNRVKEINNKEILRIFTLNEIEMGVGKENQLG